MGFVTNIHPSRRFTSGDRSVVSALLAEWLADNDIDVPSFERHLLADDICNALAGRLRGGHDAF